jgi:hypothetical protein
MRFSLPSPAGVISVVALFVALGGTGYAATKIVSPHARAALAASHARRIADHEIARKAPALSVARANLANIANRATIANVANAANVANNANNANNLGGQPPSAYLPSSSVTTLGGVKKVVAGTIGQVIAQRGPFTLMADCRRSGPTTTVDLRATSSEGGSSLGGSHINAPANSGLSIETATDSGSGMQTESNGNTDSLVAPSGAQADVISTVGVNGFATNCYITAVILP